MRRHVWCFLARREKRDLLLTIDTAESSMLSPEPVAEHFPAQVRYAVVQETVKDFFVNNEYQYSLPRLAHVGKTRTAHH